MLDLKPGNTPAKSLSPVTLAFIGDGVFELMVRERLLQDGVMPVRKLHVKAAGRVNGAAQALAYDMLLTVCNDEEQSILKRGRNVSLSRMPNSCTSQQYHKATAIEALFGYLYLNGDIERLKTIFDLIDAQYSARG